MHLTADLHLCDLDRPGIECHGLVNYKDRDIHVLKIGPVTVFADDDQLEQIAGVIAQYRFERAETVVPAKADLPPACPDCGAPMVACDPGWRCYACGNYEPPMMVPDRRPGSQIDVDGLFTRMAHGFGSRREAWEAE
jgi:hypothetical protein